VSRRLAALLVLACTASLAQAQAQQDANETGLASWYGKRFHGRRTASGEAFDMHALTAAHPNLPFGSWVRVSDPDNGRSVDVRINDRGPHVKQRIIDLSRGAAQALGLVGRGTRKVVITVLTEAERLGGLIKARPAASDAPTELIKSQD
jgi:rare lipoprotein A